MNAHSRTVARPRCRRSRLLALGLFGALLGVPAASSAAVNAGHAVLTGSTDELVIIEGYQSGSQVTIDVVRGGVRIGTTGPLTVPAEGAVEVNHPVDAGQTPTCFKDFTPNIVFGDEIHVTQGTTIETSRVRNVTVTDPVDADGNPLTLVVDVHGTAPEGATRLPVEELGVRLINPVFQTVSGGGPFVEAGVGAFGALTYDAPLDLTNPNWTATFDFTGFPAAYAAALNPATGTEAGWLVEAPAIEGTEVGVAPEALEPGLVGCPLEPNGAYAVSKTTPNVIAFGGPDLLVQGPANLGTTDVDVAVTGVGAGPLTYTNATLATPPGVGGRTWSLTIPHADLLVFADGILTITPTFDVGAPPPVTGASRTVIKDTVGLLSNPDVTIVGGPAEGSLTGSDTATFSFTSTANDITFACNLDGAGFAACPTPHTVTGLATGPHTLQVRAEDNGTPGPVATRNWNVDVTPPDTTITGGTSGSVSLPTATFTFTSPDPTATFDCRLDTGVYTPCTSPVTFNAVPVGAHTVFVRAKDTVGNQDPSPASQSFTVLGAPNTTLVAAPPASTTLTTATFGFTSDGPGATFECSLDGAAFSFCASPVNLSGLTIGSHTFRVRAVDTIGTADPTPATHAWTVTLPDTERPDVRASLDPIGKLTIGRNGRLTVRGRCDERCTLFARATVSVPKLRGGKPTLYTLQSRTVDSAANTTSSVVLRLTGRQLAVVRNALKAGKSVRVTITVVGRDASGNRGSALRTIFLTKKHL